MKKWRLDSNQLFFLGFKPFVAILIWGMSLVFAFIFFTYNEPFVDSIFQLISIVFPLTLGFLTFGQEKSKYFNTKVAENVSDKALKRARNKTKSQIINETKQSRYYNEFIQKILCISIYSFLIIILFIVLKINCDMFKTGKISFTNINSVREYFKGGFDWLFSLKIFMKSIINYLVAYFFLSFVRILFILIKTSL